MYAIVFFTLHPSAARTTAARLTFHASVLRQIFGKPQQELPPALTRRAASPYFSFTTSLMFSVIALTVFSYLQQTTFCGSTALFRVQHSA